MFRRDDVGPANQEVGRQTDRHRCKKLVTPKHCRWWQIVWQGRTHQQLQGVERLCLHTPHGLPVRTNGFHLPLGLLEVEGRGHSRVVTSLYQAVSVLARLKRFRHQLPQLLSRTQSKIRFRHLADQIDAYSTLRLGRSKKLSTGCLAEIADTAEEIQLECGHCHTRHVAARHTGSLSTAHAHALGGARNLCITANTEGGQTLTICNTVLRTRLFHSGN